MIGHSPKFVRAVLACVGVFLAAYAAEIAVDAWIVNHEPGPATDSQTPPTVHIRHYLLPVGGFFLSVVAFLRCSVPAGNAAVRVIERGGPVADAIRPALRALAWAAAAAIIFQAAAMLQCLLFGFFLPP